MKKYIFLLTVTLLFAVSAHAQLVRDVQQPGVSDATDSMVRPGGQNFVSNFLGSAFDDSHFQMHHSYSMTYDSFVGRTIGQYTNTMMYQFDFPLMVRADISYMHEPFGSFGSKSGGNFNQLYLQNAELDYKPSKDFDIKLQYMQLPYASYGYYGSPYGYRNPFGW